MATLNIRNVDPETLETLNRSCRARGLTQGEYLKRLVEFHHAMRQLAQEWDDDDQAFLRGHDEPSPGFGQQTPSTLKTAQLVQMLKLYNLETVRA